MICKMITVENIAGVLFVNVALFDIYLEHIKGGAECLIRPSRKKMYIIAFGLYLTKL